MRYKASIHLKQADTAGRVPASILDGFVREELLRQISAALKPNLTVEQAIVTENAQPVAYTDQVDFTTELVILPSNQWNQFIEQLRQWCDNQLPNETHELNALLSALEKS